jgi:hypothetical protein
MKKTFFLFILLNLFQHFSFAQKDSLQNNPKYKMIISLSGGTAIPEGAFGKFESQNAPYIYTGGNIAGAAAIGYYGKFDFSYLFHKNFGLTAMLCSSVNSSKDLTTNESKSPQQSSGGGAGFKVTSYKQDSKEWRTNGALIGIYAQTNYQSLSFDIRFSVGAQQVISPEAHLYEEGYLWHTGQGITGYYSHVETQPYLISYNVAANLGMNISYNISKKLKVRIGIENYFSQAQFEGELTYTTVTNNTNGSTEYSESKQGLYFVKKVLFLGLNAGISYVIK